MTILTSKNAMPSSISTSDFYSITRKIYFNRLDFHDRLTMFVDANAYKRTCLALYLLSYNSMAMKSTSIMFQCLTVADSNVLYGNPTVSCQSSEFNFLQSVAVLIFLGLNCMLPCFMYVFLYRSETTQFSPTPHGTFGILFECYRPPTKWFAFFAMFRQLTFVCSSSALYLSDSKTFAVKGFCFVCFTIFCVMIQIFKRPFAHHIDNWLELMSLTIITVTVCAINMMSSIGTSWDSVSFRWLAGISFVPYLFILGFLIVIRTFPKAKWTKHFSLLK